MKLVQLKKYLLLIDEEAEIEEWDFYYDLKSKPFPIKQSIENSHKDFKSYKIIAYYPLTNKAAELDLPLLPNPFEDSFNITTWSNEVATKQFSLDDVKKAIEMAREIRYSTEEIIQSLSTQQLPVSFEPEYRYYYHSSKEFYSDAGFVECSKEQYESIKVEIPTCPLKAEIKTIINSEGKQVIQGTYKY